MLIIFSASLIQGPCLKLLQWNPCLQRFFSSEIYIPVCLVNGKCYTVLNATSWNLKIWLNVGHSRKNMATLLKAPSIEDNDFFTFHRYCIIIKNGIFLVQRIFILSFYIFWPLEIWKLFSQHNSIPFIKCIFYYFETDVFLMKYSCFLKCYCHNQKHGILKCSLTVICPRSICFLA